VICLVGYYGGFRNVELKSLLFENVECDQMGYWFSFERSKQRKKIEDTTICVPRRQKDWIPCVVDSGRKAIDYDPASVIDAYYEAVMQDLDCKFEDLKGCFFKGTHGKSGKRFIKTTIGKNMIALVGSEVASELCLQDPETFTGHCWRRSAGTNASNAGVNVTTLMSMMGWSCPKTAMQYVDRSRISSLKLSMYLANVQRRNCSDPFPSGSGRVSRKLKFSGMKKEVSMAEDPDSVRVRSDADVSNSVQVRSESEAMQEGFSTPKFSSKEVETAPNVSADFSATEIVTDSRLPVVCSNIQIASANRGNSLLESTSSSTEKVVNDLSGLSSATLSNDFVLNSELSSVDRRLTNILHNLQNNGNVHIHFNFCDGKH